MNILEKQNQIRRADDDGEKIFKAYEELQEDFEGKTRLSLSIRYHEANDRGDEINGAFWEVSKVYQLTSAGKEYEDKIKRKFWAVWG